MNHVSDRRNHAALHTLAFDNIGQDEDANFLWKCFNSLQYMNKLYMQINVEARNRLPYQHIDNTRGIFRGWSDEDNLNDNASFNYFNVQTVFFLAESLRSVTSASNANG